jgi:peptidoglycan-associated lipoprotein
MTDSRRDFLMRFAATAVAAAGAGCETATPEATPDIRQPIIHVVYGPPPGGFDRREEFYSRIGNQVFFGGGRLDLGPEAKAMLDRQIQWLKSAPPYPIILQGHCDERGSREYNLALGERRAEAVKIYMVSQGLAHDRITVLSFGREQPVDEGHTEAAWAKNRRVETVLEPLLRR